MFKRRSVLKLSVASVAGALVNVPSRAIGTGPIESRPLLYRGVYDERFTEALAFAGELENRGVRTSGIRGDVAKLWYEDLRNRLAERAAPIAGLTDRAALFCLEELMRDVGMKMLFRVDHLIDRNGNVEHRATGPASLVQATYRLPPAFGFGPTMAVVANHHAVNERRDTAAQKRFGPFSPANRTALVSWVIV